MSSYDLLVLPSGTPLIMVETLIDCEERETLFLAELPKVYAGRLAEPHPLTEGLCPSLLVEGACARSFSSEDFDSRAVLWTDEGETLMIFISPEGDAHLRILWVLEDLRGQVAAAEASDLSAWASAEETRQRLYRAVIEPFSFFIADSFLELFAQET